MKALPPELKRNCLVAIVKIKNEMDYDVSASCDDHSISYRREAKLVLKFLSELEII